MAGVVLHFLTVDSVPLEPRRTGGAAGLGSIEHAEGFVEAGVGVFMGAEVLSVKKAESKKKLRRTPSRWL